MENTADRLDRAFRPQRIADCLGQGGIRRNLQVYVAAAKNRGEPIEHMLFCGQAGLGKTTLAGALAAEMGGKLVVVNSPSLKTKGELAAIIGQLSAGDILFLDEIHALKRELQELLYPVMEDFMLEIAAGTTSISIPLPAFTVVGATTHMGKLSKPMRDRFGDICELQPYNVEELASIVVRGASKMNFGLAQDGALEIARRAQGTPRVALRILRRVRDFAHGVNPQELGAGFVEQVCAQIGIDKAGLDSTARKMLRLLAEKNRAVGLKAIAAQIGEAVETVEDCVEPFLLSQGLVERVQAGRCITPKGTQHIMACAA